MGYIKETISGLTWVGTARVATRMFSFVRTAVLARILLPAQFGVYGIASLVLSFLEVLTETGINVVLIQEKDDIDEYINSAWVVSIVRGFLIMLLILSAAPYVSSFFSSYESLNIIRLISLVALIRGFINPSIIKFRKELNFKKDSFYKISVFVVDSLVAIIFAFALRSPVSIVFGLIAGAMFEVVLSHSIVTPRPQLAFETNKIKRIISKGKWITLKGIFEYTSQEGDDVVVGKILDTYMLGLYQVSYKISTLPITEIVQIVTPVTFAVYSKINDDAKRLRRAFVRVGLSTVLLVIPLGVIIYLFPELIIKILLGENWLEAVPVLQVLAIFGVIRAIVIIPNSMFLSMEKQKWLATMQFVQTAALAVTIFPLTINYGVLGAAYSTIIAQLISLPLVLYYLYKLKSILK